MIAAARPYQPRLSADPEVTLAARAPLTGAFISCPRGSSIRGLSPSKLPSDLPSS